MPVAFTESQQKAIDTKDKTLLVSAAAGAGKTSTLSARIISSLCDKHAPADLSRMLVITFTKASANDLRAGIRKRMSEARDAFLSEGRHEEADRLSRTLAYLPSADIRTVDSFLVSLLRAHSTELGLPSDIRVADRAESDLLARDALDALISRIYDEADPEVASAAELALLSEALCSTRSEKQELGAILLSFYDSVIHDPEATLRLGSLCEEMKKASEMPFGKSKWAEHIYRRTCDAAATCAELLRVRLGRIPSDDEDARRVFDRAFSAELDFLDRVPNTVNMGYTPMRTALFEKKNVAFRKPLSNYDGEAWYAELKEAYEHIKKTLAHIRTSYYLYTEQQFPPLLRALGQSGDVLCRVTERFDRLFSEAKLRHRICDYPDLERYALRLLYLSDGSLSAAALSVRDHYDYVYVDEYQDINEAQHRIISAVSRENNCFMVGDIKQSIYSFRAAEPGNFAHMRRRFPPLSAAEGSPNAVLCLSENFRSDEPVISYINRIFDVLFPVCDIGYVSEEDALRHGKAADGAGEYPHLTLLDYPQDTAPEPGSEPESEPDTEADAVTPEAGFVAEKIKELLAERSEDGTPKYMPGDIAVLLRRRRGRSEAFAAALASRGVPCCDVEEKDFFLSPEILLALCLLNAIDNPLRDIYLSGLMMSPIYGFTADETAQLRQPGDYIPLYDSLCRYSADHPENTKCAVLIDDLHRYRDLSCTLGAYALLRKLLDESGLYALCGKDGSTGRINLNLLCQYARSFESSSFYGLHSFIDYINQLIRRGRGYESPSVSYDDPTRVQIMTVHSSKGLERKVCFLCGCSAPFHVIKKEPCIFHPELGFGFSVGDSTGFVRVANPIRNLIADTLTAEQRAEEMRVLYVALTRAKERLYLTGMPSAGNSTCAKLLSAGECLYDAPTPYALLRATSFTQMILAAVGRHDASVSVAGMAELCENRALPHEPPAVCTADESITAMFKERFAFEYPFAYLRTVPGKLSVSRLSPSVLDDTDTLTADLTVPQDTHTVPVFAGGAEEKTMADAGIATHKFMQFCSFPGLAEHGVDSEIMRLCDRGFLDGEDTALIVRDELELFRRSDLMKILLSAKKIYREQRFHLNTAAASFTSDPELKEKLADSPMLVQGVIDCIAVCGDGSLLLCDYKTDRMTAREKADPEWARKKLTEKHGKQLYYYRLAVTEMFGTAPGRVCIYSLPLGRLTDISRTSSPCLTNTYFNDIM